MKKSILFDLDDTLLDFKKAEAAAIRKALQDFNVEPTEAIVSRYSEINASQWRLLEAGQLTREQVLIRRFELLFQELALEQDALQIKLVYEDYLKQGHYFMPGAVELLEALQEEYDLYLVSNGTAVVQDSRLKSAGIGHFFQQMFISQRVGYDKPKVEFFHKCFEAIPGFEREHAIIVGDSLTSDIQGGINAGILTCWYNPRRYPASTEIMPDYEIQELSQLPELLHRIFA